MPKNNAQHVISISKLHNGAWQISAVIRQHLVTRTYYGFIKRKSIALFRAEVDKSVI